MWRAAVSALRCCCVHRVMSSWRYGRNDVQVVGLRNAGMSGTRHNVGEAFLHHLEQHIFAGPLAWHNHRSCDGIIASVKFPEDLLPAVAGRRDVRTVCASGGASTTVHLFKPSGYMNVSGTGVWRAMQHVRVPPEAVCIVHDGKNVQ